MTAAEIIVELIVTNLGISQYEVFLSSSLPDDLGADTDNIDKIFEEIEEIFEIEMPNGDARDAMLIVRNIIEFVEEKKPGKFAILVDDSIIATEG